MFQNIIQEFLSEHFTLIFFFYINVCLFLNLACSSWTSSSDRHEWLYSLASSKNDLRQNISFSSAFLIISGSGWHSPKKAVAWDLWWCPVVLIWLCICQTPCGASDVPGSSYNTFLTLLPIMRPPHSFRQALEGSSSPTFIHWWTLIKHLLCARHWSKWWQPKPEDPILKDKVCWSLNPSGALEHLGIKSLTPHFGCHRTAKYKGNEYFH